MTHEDHHDHGPLDPMRGWGWECKTDDCDAAYAPVHNFRLVTVMVEPHAAHCPGASREKGARLVRRLLGASAQPKLALTPS